MASTYTDNTGIEKPGPGEQSGSWGTTTNTNFDIIDRSLNGVGEITLAGTTHTLSTSDGATSDGHYRVLVLGGSPTGSNTITISPNDQDKVYLVYNNTSYSAVFTQGSGGDATITAGATAWIYADGKGTSAAVRAVPADLVDDTSPQLGANLDVNGNSIVSVSNGDIAITPHGTGDVIIDGIKYPQADGNANEILTTDGAGQLSFTALGASNSFAAGMLMPYAGATAPTGWLLCYGQSELTADYPDLYSVIGYTYGGSGGSFNIPDLRGRVIAGQDNMGGVSADRLTNQSGGLDGDGLGNTGGTETHTLALTEMPNSFYYNSNLLSKDDYVDNHAGSNFIARVADVTSHTTQGGGGAHNNVQPTLILNYIIKT